MQTDMAIVTISCFASGSDVAVGVIVPAKRQATVFWVSESRIEQREISPLTMARVEFEATMSYVPRRLPAGSAIARALFHDDRLNCTSTEIVSASALPCDLDSLLSSIAVDMRSPQGAPPPDAEDIGISQIYSR